MTEAFWGSKARNHGNPLSVVLRCDPQTRWRGDRAKPRPETRPPTSRLRPERDREDLKGTGWG